MVEDTDVVYIALLKTTSLCIFVAKSHRSSEALFFTFSDSLPAVKSNTVFGKITLIGLPFKSKKIWFTSVSAWRNEQQQQHPCLNQKRSKALGINIMKKAF